jgi:hypothetical protein
MQAKLANKGAAFTILILHLHATLLQVTYIFMHKHMHQRGKKAPTNQPAAIKSKNKGLVNGGKKQT